MDGSPVIALGAVNKAVDSLPPIFIEHCALAGGWLEVVQVVVHFSFLSDMGLGLTWYIRSCHGVVAVRGLAGVIVRWQHGSQRRWN